MLRRCYLYLVVAVLSFALLVGALPQQNLPPATLSTGRLPSLSTPDPSQAAQLAQDEYNICIFLQSQAAQILLSSGTSNRLATPTSGSLTHGTRVAASSTIENRAVYQGRCSGPPTGLVRAPSTTVVSGSQASATVTQAVATFFADVVPTLVDVWTTTAATVTDAGGGFSTVAVGPGGLFWHLLSPPSADISPSAPPISLYPKWTGLSSFSSSKSSTPFSTNTLTATMEISGFSEQHSSSKSSIWPQSSSIPPVQNPAILGTSGSLSVTGTDGTKKPQLTTQYTASTLSPPTLAPFPGPTATNLGSSSTTRLSQSLSTPKNSYTSSSENISAISRSDSLIPASITSLSSPNIGTSVPAFAASTTFTSGTLLVAFGLSTSTTPEDPDSTLGPILTVVIGTHKFSLMHSKLSLGPLRGPKTGRSCPPILVLICKANNIDGAGPVDDAIIDPTDEVEEEEDDDDDDDNTTQKEPDRTKEQKSEPSETEEHKTTGKTLNSSATSKNTKPASSVSSITRLSKTTDENPTQTSISATATSTETTTAYVIIGKPGADDQAITNFLQQVLDPTQFLHLQYQKDETGTTGSDWFFSDMLNGTDTFSEIPGLTQTQIDTIEGFSGVSYTFPDTMVEQLVDSKRGTDSESTITEMPDIPDSGGSTPWKRDPQVGYTRQVNARNELKFLSNYFISDEPEEPDYTNEDYVYEEPAGTNTWVYLISETYDVAHPEYRQRVTGRPVFAEGFRMPRTIDTISHGTCVISKIAGLLYGVAKQTTIIPVIGWGARRNARWGDAIANLAAAANDIRRRQRSTTQQGALPGKTVVLQLRQIAGSLSRRQERAYREHIEALFQLGASYVTTSGYTYDGPERAPGTFVGPDFPIIKAAGVEYNGTLAEENWEAEIHAIDAVKCAYPGGRETMDYGSCYGVIAYYASLPTPPWTIGATNRETVENIKNFITEGYGSYSRFPGGPRMINNGCPGGYFNDACLANQNPNVKRDDLAATASACALPSRVLSRSTTVALGTGTGSTRKSAISSQSAIGDPNGGPNGGPNGSLTGASSKASTSATTGGVEPMQAPNMQTSSIGTTRSGLPTAHSSSPSTTSPSTRTSQTSSSASTTASSKPLSIDFGNVSMLRTFINNRYSAIDHHPTPTPPPVPTGPCDCDENSCSPDSAPCCANGSCAPSSTTCTYITSIGLVPRASTELTLPTSCPTSTSDLAWSYQCARSIYINQRVYSALCSCSFCGVEGTAKQFFTTFRSGIARLSSCPTTTATTVAESLVLVG